MAANYDPDFYDIATPQTFGGDVEWYRRKVREAGGPVLELGAGTGRVTIAIAQDGASVWALDADTGMLGALKRKVDGLPRDVQKRVTIVEGDMRTFALETRFALVISPFRAFLHNLTHDDQLACARCVYGHLLPGGRFAFNIFHPSLEYMARSAGALAGVWRLTATHPLPDGGSLVRSEANQYRHRATEGEVAASIRTVQPRWESHANIPATARTGVLVSERRSLAAQGSRIFSCGDPR